MKKFNCKLLCVLACLLAVLVFMAACDKTDDPTETVGETNTNAPEVTTTDPEQNTSAETETEANASESVTLSSNEALEALKNAIAATEKKTSSKIVMEMGMSMMGQDMGTVKTIEITDGVNFIYTEEAEGMSSTAVILGDKAYFADSYEGQQMLYVVPLTADQRAWVVSQYASESDEGADFGADSFTGLSGVKNSDGSVKLTATGLSEELMKELMGDMGDDAMVELSLTLNVCELTISADGLLKGITLDMVMSGSASQEGISVDVSVAMKASVTAEYDNIIVFAPENAADYVEDTFDSYFMITPDSEEAADAGLPLDKDSYIIGAEGSEDNADDQFMMLAYYPTAYAGKTFTIYGIVGTDEELGAPVIHAGEYGTFYFYCPQGVKAPAYGDSVKITATFENTVDKGYDSDYYCYAMMVSNCEVMAHGFGPNGGRIMFITASSLNVRTSSDTSSSDNILGTLSKGDAVEVFDQDEKGWWRIEFKGQTAYISNKYVSETRP